VREVVAVPADLEQQHAALCERVTQSGLYRNEIAEFGVARAQYPRIAEQAGVVADLGSLTTYESRNIVRKVRLADGRLAVLKVMGQRREPGEGEVLAVWTTKGLPCVRPLKWGDGRATWLLTGYLPLPSMPTVPDTAGRGSPRHRPARRGEIVRCSRPSRPRALHLHRRLWRRAQSDWASP
jgi:hypothetical protein